MPSYTNLSCITDLIDIHDPCAADQSWVTFFLDDLGLSLQEASDAADERYITGRNLVDQKTRIALGVIAAAERIVGAIPARAFFQGSSVCVICLSWKAEKPLYVSQTDWINSLAALSNELEGGGWSEGRMVCEP